MSRPDLFNATPESMRDFVVGVVGLATQDERTGYEKTRTGQEIAGMIASQYRVMHRRLASTIYNQTRASLKMAPR